MDTGYETVVDPATIVWTMAAMGVHVATMGLQLWLSFFLLATGLSNLLAPNHDSPLARRFGAVRIVAEATVKIGAARLLLGLGLLAPLAIGAPLWLSLLCCAATVGLLTFLERGLGAELAATGRFARRFAMASGVVLFAFASFEGEDPLSLGADLISTANSWRAHEVAWQRSNDAEAPKVGELAPDFELQDPEGRSSVRLADFRGKRPVALVFGSYT